MNTRYIIVLFHKGIGYTIQTDDKPHIFFKKYAKVYKRIGSAVKKANYIFNHYINDKVCVFKVTLNEELSCDQYNNWYKDENRLMWDSSKCYNY